jgi:hypothetical protein
MVTGVAWGIDLATRADDDGRIERSQSVDDDCVGPGRDEDLQRPSSRARHHRGGQGRVAAAGDGERARSIDGTDGAGPLGDREIEREPEKMARLV